MLFAVVAGLAGLVWGIADFAGGKASRRADALRVVWLSKLVSLPLLSVCVLLGGDRPSPSAVLWGALAGGFGLLGTVLFYRALAQGAMTVVAPVTSVTSASVPVAVGLASGERPSSSALGGVLCALVAVALVSVAAPATGDRTGRPRLVALAVGAGLGFALFMVCLGAPARSGDDDSGLWPLLGAQVTGLLLGGALLAARRSRSSSAGAAGGLGWVCTAGLLDTSGSALYLTASRHGDLSLVAPIAALYPVTTVLLALLVDRERPRRPQLVGLVLAVAALDLVARPTG